nr:WXG100 family type VII secretion target [Pseudonocardia sp. C8]
MVAAEDLDARTDAAFEGSGIVSSYYDVGEALDEQDAGGVAWAAAAAGLDTLGAVADPLGTLVSAGVGFLIEHVGFLREPLDALAGDPEQVAAAARTWQDVSRTVTAGAGELRAAVTSARPAWDGDAAAAFAAGAGRIDASAAEVAAEALRLADLVLRSGAAVGTVRALIRDAVADFVAGVIAKAAVTLLTGGTAAPATLTAVVLDAVALAYRLSDRVEDAIRMLRTAGEHAERVRAVFEAVPGTAAGVESGKQEAAARAAAAEGRPAPTG